MRKMDLVRFGVFAVKVTEELLQSKNWKTGKMWNLEGQKSESSVAEFSSNSSPDFFFMSWFLM